MARYAVDLHRTASLTLAVGHVAASATPRRIKLNYLAFGVEGAAADAASRWDVNRSTTDGTSTSVTPLPLDPADAAALSVASENHTVNGTVTSGEILLSVPVNQRAVFQWYAPPGGELVIPATDNAGVHIMTPTAPLLACTATVHFDEQ